MADVGDGDDISSPLHDEQDEAVAAGTQRVGAVRQRFGGSTELQANPTIGMRSYEYTYPYHTVDCRCARWVLDIFLPRCISHNHTSLLLLVLLLHVLYVALQAWSFDRARVVVGGRRGPPRQNVRCNTRIIVQQYIIRHQSS